MVQRSAPMAVQKSFWDYFWLAKFYFRFAGILPVCGPLDEPLTSWKSLLTGILAFSPLVHGLYVVIPQVNFILYQNHTVDDLLEAVIILITTVGGQSRIFFAALHRRKIMQFFAFCKTFWDQSDPTDFKVTSIWAYRAKLFSTTYFCAAQLSITLFVLTSTIKQISSASNSTVKYYPFRFKEYSIPSPEYEIKYTVQVLIGYVGTTHVVAADMFGTLLALNVCGQLALVRNWFLEMSDKQKSNLVNTDERVEIGLRKCIHRHQIIMEFCAELEEVVQYINLIQVVTGLYILAIALARLIEGLGSYRYLGPLLSSIAGLYYLCSPAENLSFTSSDIAHAVYGVPWYLYSSRDKTAIEIMLARSQKPAQLTAGKFLPLSLEAFYSIVSSAVSFSLILHQI